MAMPIPPVGGWAAPSDDWTDDPSFDLSEGGSLPPSSPSSSSSRSSRPSNPRTLTGSPLRQMHLKTAIEDDDFVLDDNDFDEGPPTLKARLIPLQSTPPAAAASSTPKARATMTTIRPPPAASTSNMKSLTANAMVMGQGPTGVGTITRLGGSAKAPVLPTGSVKARARAIEKAWEADVDFDSSFDHGGSSGQGDSAGDLKLKLKPKLASPAVRMPDVDALDDLPDLDDDDQLTLKASATLKAKLPPPRRKDDSAATIKAKPPPKPQDEEDPEGDLVLPLSLTNLTLATQSQPRKLRPRASMASTTTTTTTDWDVPSTPSTTGRKSTAGGFSWGEDTPSLGRHSETSMTSVSDTPDKAKTVDEDFEGEDYEDGLVLPDPTFFASRNATHLNKILDRKRKQEYAATVQQHPPPLRGDDSFEDGLVLDNPRAELSHRRLEKSRRNRTIPAPFLLGADRRKAEIAKLGYPIPPPPPIPQSPAVPPRSGARSPGGSLRSSASKQQRSENPFMPRTPSRTRRTSDHQLAPPLPPMPAPPMPSRIPVAPATPHRLRTQKSHHNLGPATAPALTRKQSLASMQDAIAAGHVRPDTDLPSLDPSLRSGQSTSRLQMPTSSSLAKMRPPVSSASQNRKRMLEPPRRTKHWGDGTELEGIEDLRVDDDAKSPARSAGSRSPHSSLRGKKSYERSLAKALPTPKVDEKDKKPKRRQRRPAMLIKNLGATDRPKTVGEMTWNPRTLRWEGNEGVLRDFDAVVPSARPALISHFTGSSIASSPLGAAGAAPAMRIVGDMKFDPEKMCWVSLLPPDEAEPDPFADMADDEDESVCGSGTITRAAGRKLMSIGAATRFVSESSAATGLTAMSGLTGASTVTAASWEDRTPVLRTEMPELWAECREAEERHRREMRGWSLRPIQGQSDVRERERREEKRLWEVRNLAMRS